MAEISLKSTEKPLVQAVSEKVSRLTYVDHLRGALVALVVVHHVALIYGAGAPFYYVEPPLTEPLAYLVLLTFGVFNQAWFMGALFLLAGYFTPRSYDRKGQSAFLRGRLRRLGIPLLVFFFVLGPIASTAYWQMPASLTGIAEPLTWGAYPFLLGMGPLWFVALLLIFDFGYAGWRRLTANRPAAPERDSPGPRYLSIAIYILVLAVASYLVRIVIPLGREVLDFPTLAYLPQYASFFAIGVVAARRNWLQSVSGARGIVGFVTALVATVFLFPLALSGRLFSLEVSEAAAFVGNGTWQSAVYALWDAIFGVGIFLAAITFFRRFFDAKSRLGTFLSQQSYAVYIIHTPIIVYLAVALKGIQPGALLKFVLVTALSLPLCFLVAYIVRRLPVFADIL